MSVDLLRIVLPTRFLACGDCEVAAAFASQISTSNLRETAKQMGLTSTAWIQIHCSDRFDNINLVPDIRQQVAMQAQARDGESIVGLTEPEVVECPGKVRAFPSDNLRLL